MRLLEQHLHYLYVLFHDQINSEGEFRRLLIPRDVHKHEQSVKIPCNAAGC